MTARRRIALAIALVLALLPLASAQEGENAPHASLAWEGVPADPVELKAGESASLDLTLHFTAANFACTQDSLFPVSLGASGPAAPTNETVSFPAATGLYAGGDAYEDAAVVRVTVTAPADGNGTLPATLTAALATGMPDNCFGAGEFPAASATADLTLEVEGEEPAEEEPPGNETGEEEEGPPEETPAEPPGEADARKPLFVPGPGMALAACALAAAGLRRRRA